MHLPRSLRLTAALVVLGALAFASGCYFLPDGRRTDRSSSVVNFLYPGESNPLPPTTIPVLRLPLRVGIAFVPTGSAKGGYEPDTHFSEVQKRAVLERVKAEFKSRPYVQSIEIIPSTYLRPGGGFENLDQLHSMLGVDVIALVAYDQVQFTSENLLSLTYWTIVGAYIFHGNRNDTHTLMEAAVYDIPSRHLLFRAPGASQVSAGSAGVDLRDNLRLDAAKGLDLATTEMIQNLAAQLEEFRERVKQAPGEFQIEHKPGYVGSGSFGGGFAVALALLGLARWRWRRA